MYISTVLRITLKHDIIKNFHGAQKVKKAVVCNKAIFFMEFSLYPGTVFIYHEDHLHTTLLIDNNGLVSSHVTTIADYTNMAQDSFKAWILPASGEHWLASRNHEYRFDEFQVRHNILY